MKNQEAVDAHETENDEEFKNTEINYEKLICNRRNCHRFN